LNPATDDSDQFFTEAGAAKLLALAPGHLRNLRQRGAGPRASKFGRAIRYWRQDLLAWAVGPAVVDGEPVVSVCLLPHEITAKRFGWVLDELEAARRGDPAEPAI
jgi:hypothetical protein